MQFSKLGNSKILVVKKKLAGVLSTNTINGQTAGGGFNQVSNSHVTGHLYQNQSQQRTQLDEYQNSLMESSYKIEKISSKVLNSRSFTPVRPQTAANKSIESQIQTPQMVGNGQKQIQHQMININNLPKNDKLLQSQHQNKVQNSKHVGFNLKTDKLMNEKNNGQQSETSSAERIEEHRQQNSKRQFKIKKGARNNSKSKALKSPSNLTNCGKSVISLFSNHSGKTNKSEPLTENNLINDSPDYKAKYNIAKKLKKGLKVKKRIRPTSSISPSNTIGSFKDTTKQFNLSATHFNQSQKVIKIDKSIIDADNRDNSLDSVNKKMIPMKKISLKKSTIGGTLIGGLPKPPLHKKNMFEENSQSLGGCCQSTTEAILKMADESLAAMEQELKESKTKSKTTLNSIVNSIGNSVEKKPRQVTLKPQKEKIQTNFNLSFNNSFNNSYNNQANQPSQVLAFSSSAVKNNSETINHETQPSSYQGFFTADAIYLERHLTNRLNEAQENEDKKMQAFNSTFNEVIKRDKNFGSLLLKIKHAYDDYIKKSNKSQMNSPEIGPQYEELLSKVRTQDQYIMQTKQTQDDLSLQVKKLQEQLDDKQKIIEQIQIENDKLIVSCKNDSFKVISQSHKINKSASLGESTKSLQLSNSSNRTNSVTNSKVGANRQGRKQLINDLNILVQQNMQFNNECQLMQNEVTYFKLREKKIMYLVTLLQNKGYPVNQVFDSEVKNIPTLRFQEFLENNPDIEDPDDDVKNLFSFRSEDSFERLQTGPLLLGKRPNFVPKLNLKTLPVYESSSDEEEQDNGKNPPQKQFENNPLHYQESLKYIENYYSKYAGDKQKGAAQSIDYNTSVNQISYQDTLSRDEDGDDDIQEEFQYA